jgi:hypothetical protein
MSRLQVPQEVAMMQMQKQQQKNQIYSMAFSIYCQFIRATDIVNDADVLARKAIELARVFDAVVKEDAQK